MAAQMSFAIDVAILCVFSVALSPVFPALPVKTSSMNLVSIAGGAKASDCKNCADGGRGIFAHSLCACKI